MVAGAMGALRVALGPKALAGTRKGLVLGVSALLGYLALFFADLLLPEAVTVGSLSYVLVVITAWTLSGRATVLLTLAGISLRILAALLGDVAAVTALAQATGIPVIAVLAHVAARNAVHARKAVVAGREAGDLGFLLETSQSILASLDLERVIHDAVASTAELIGRNGQGGIARAAFHKLDGDRLRIVADRDAAGPTYRENEYPLEWNRAAVLAVESGRVTPVTADDLSPELREIALRGGWTGGALAPVRAGEHVYGLLVATIRDRPALDADELRLLGVLAHAAGLAIGNAELLSRQLAQTRAVEALDDAKSEFLRLASHELRAPLTVIGGYVSLLAEGALGETTPAAGKALGQVDAKVREMTRLIDQLLDVARIEDSSLFLKREPVDLRNLVAEAASAAVPLGEDRQVEVSMPAGPVLVNVDPERVRTIVTNLIRNALKYSPGGQAVRTTIETGDRVRVRVADSGIGIAEEDLPRLFTRFGRLVRGEDAQIPGTGLGLYLSRELARLHGGEIAVESTSGKGSTFTLELPL